MMWRRFGPALAGVAALVLVASGCGSGGGSGGSKGSVGSWTNAILAPKGDSGYELMAQDRGYFRRQGVSVKIQPFNGNTQMLQAVISGAVDSAEIAPDSVYPAVLKGAPLRIIGATIAGQTEDIYSKASIKNLHQLQGRSLGVSAPNSFPEIITKAMMVTKGAKPDLKIVPSGNATQRIQALYSGRVDATTGGAEFAPKITENPKFHVLAQSQDIVPQYPRLMIVTSQRTLRQKPQVAERFLAGEIEGLRYAEAHPDAEIALAAKTTKASPKEPALHYIQKLIADSHAVATNGQVPMGKLRWLQDFLVRYGFQKGKVDLSKLVDDSYRQKALKRLGR